MIRLRGNYLPTFKVLYLRFNDFAFDRLQAVSPSVYGFYRDDTLVGYQINDVDFPEHGELEINETTVATINQLLKLYQLQPLEVDLDTYLTVIEIVEVTAHPKNPKLVVTQCSDGERKYQVVTNLVDQVQVGMRTVIALEKAIVGGVYLTPTMVSGVLSEGMFVSQRTLGIGDQSATLIDVGDQEIGMRFKR